MLEKGLKRYHGRTRKQRRYFIKSNLFLIIVVTLFILILSEVILRLSGYIPGYIPRYSNKKFRPVEDLEVLNRFFTDKEGVFKANPNGDWGEFPEVNINDQGFRSISFKNCKDGRFKLLLLGDSFAWGASAKPITNSFADIILKKGYCVFNTGIPGTDPQQYSFLAEKFVPILKPDIVVLTFYMGNDFHSYWPMLPYKNLWHVTNVGWLLAFDGHGNHFTAEEAYEKYLARNNLVSFYLHNDNGNRVTVFIKKSLIKSVIGTYLYVNLSKLKLFISSLFKKSPHNKSAINFSYLERRKQIFSKTRNYLFNIKKISEDEGTIFKLFVIPVRPEIKNKKNSLEENFMLFDGLKPLIPQDLTSADYAKLPDNHFNNSGHKKFATFILESLSTDLKQIESSLNNKREP